MVGTRQSVIRWWRVALLVLSLSAVLVGAVRLSLALPWGNYFPYYWDGGSLLEAVQHEGFILGRDPGLSDYALSKYGYSALVWMLYRVVGFDAPLHIGVFWFAVMLAAPALASVFCTSGRRGWFGYLAYASGMVALPFVHKYVGMTNPTIQSMALWLLLMLFYSRRPGEHGEMRGGLVLPGILCAMLALTDYKWIPFIFVGIIAVEVLDRLRSRQWDWRETWRADRLHLLKRIVLVLVWTPLVVGGVALINIPYQDALRRYVVGGNTIDAFRPALSWNLLIFLWVLGGFWAGAWLLWYWWSERRSRASAAVCVPDPLWRGCVLAGVIVVLFSVVMWPRCARMFAPAVVFGLLLFGRRAQQIWDQWDGHRARQMLSAFGLVLVMAGMAWRSVAAGSCYRQPTGVREMVQHIATHGQRIGSTPVGTYMPPLFSLASGPAIKWFFPPVRVPNETDWVVTSDFLDPTGIREQQSMRRRDWRWTVDRYETRGILGEMGVKVASFRNDFYCSASCWCESSFSDSELLFILNLAAQEKEPTWDLRYVGGIFGRPLPDTTGLGTGH